MDCAAAITPDRARVERQLDRLDELAEIGMKLARAVGRRVDEPATDEDLSALVLVYARVSRAVRLAGLLQSRLTHDLEGRETLARKGEVEAAEDAEDAGDARRDRVFNIVQRVAKARAPREGLDVETLMDDCADRLIDPDLYGDILERPISDLVARACKDLGLQPDWTDLSEELWAIEEMAGGEVGEPLMAIQSATSPARGGGGEIYSPEANSRTPAEERAGRSGGEGTSRTEAEERLILRGAMAALSDYDSA